MSVLYRHDRRKTHLLHDDASKVVRNKYDLLILAGAFSVESIKKYRRLIVYVCDGFAESGPGVIAV
jgi:hypothetical protein